MGRTFFIFIMVNNIINVSAQQYPDSLKEHSYYIYGNQKSADGSYMVSVEATCFFVRAGEKIYLVSAKHVLTSWSTADSTKPAVYPDTLFVRIPLTNSGPVTDIPVDIRDIKSGAHGSYYYNEPDIFAMEFSDPGKTKINAFNIADIAADSIATKKRDQAAAVAYGFPAGTKTNEKSPVPLSGRVFSLPDENINYRDNQRGAEVRDIVNYLVKFDEPVKPGYSGAPVFLEDKDSAKWFFAGVISQGVPEGNYMFVVKPGFLRNEIQRD
jgi:hypothetical protein